MQSQLSRLRDILTQTRKIVIVTHLNPDGDAMGSSLGLGNHLKEAGHSVTMIPPNEFPDFLAWMPGAEMIHIFSREEEQCKQRIREAEVVFCLDFNTLKRIGKLGDEIKSCKAIKILVDHHEQPDSFPDLIFHDVKACSTAQLIFDLIEGLGQKEKISRATGICLYTGIMTDTASFRFPSTSAHTHEIAAFLKQIGVETWKAHEAVYDGNSYDRLRLVGYALSEKMKVLKEVNAAYISLSRSELQQYKYRTGDTEGLVNYALSIHGIRLAAFFVERDDEVKISLRSKGAVDVNQLAREHFNGGGHKNAAGGNVSIPLSEAIAQFEKVIQTLPELRS